MRIGIIGAGGVGGAMAAVLHRQGHDVEVTARGAQLGAIRERGIHLRGAWGEHEARVSASERLSRTPDLAVLTTKAQDAATAIADNLEFLGRCPVLVVQNGLGGIQSVRGMLQGCPVVGGLAMFAASYLSPGEVTITTRGVIYLGGDDASAVAAVVEALSPALEVRAVDDFAAAQWTKLVVNQVNALPAITGMSVQAVIAHPRLRQVLTRSLRESVLVAHATGVRFATLGGLSDRMLTVMAAAPLWLGQALPWAMRRRMGSTPNPGSTLQSLRRGQKTEIDYLNGAIAEAARDAGLEAPVNATLVRLVHEVETTDTFITPEVVVARIPRY
jgi:2-dehydropantoate 2-reductase